MSSQNHNPDNLYTQQVKQLLSLVYPKETGDDSIYGDARHYFTMTPTLEQNTTDLQLQLLKIKDDEKKEELAKKLAQQIENNKEKLEEERLARLDRLESACSKVIKLCEGGSWAETQQLTAKFLGTLMLLTRGADGNFASVHQRYKPIYKAALTLRLADRLLGQDTIAHSYVSKYREALSRFRNDQYWKEKWKAELGIPLITAALLQDIGLQSPAASTILKGKNGDLDEFRLLDEAKRKNLLKINYHFTMTYLSEGLGIPVYAGNLKDEKDRFIKTHTDALKFLQELVKDAFLSKTGVGELVKIPQIYVSIVLSTKADYTRLDLPKGYLLIEQLAKKGGLNKVLAQDFLNLVGYFPQGFGIAFIPKNEKGEEKKQFEYAIVVGLNPAKPAEPICRVVTRNQNFVTSGAEEVIEKSRNLYFPSNRKKLMRLGEARLSEIMSQLSKDFSQESLDDLVPSFWEPHDFFGFKKHQNIWPKGK